jgi:deoxyguanosine kinase
VDASNADFLNNADHLQTIMDALEKEYAPGQHILNLP